MGNNQMMAVDPSTKEVRRFLVGPRGCEVTGISQTPDGRTMFVNIQHPGERPDDTPSDPNNPLSTWPENEHGRPRSATLVIERQDHSDTRRIGE
jgi:secreted PhoX family phosphatase